jgi:hypothetical protein
MPASNRLSNGLSHAVEQETEKHSGTTENIAPLLDENRAK